MAVGLRGHGLRADDAQTGIPDRLVVSVAGLWFGTLLVGLFAPLLVTGSDPTRIPLAVLLAPPMAAMLTGMLSLHEAGRQLDDKS